MNWWDLLKLSACSMASPVMRMWCYAGHMDMDMWGLYGVMYFSRYISLSYIHRLNCHNHELPLHICPSTSHLSCQLMSWQICIPLEKACLSNVKIRYYWLGRSLDGIGWCDFKSGCLLVNIFMKSSWRFVYRYRDKGQCETYTPRWCSLRGCGHLCGKDKMY